MINKVHGISRPYLLLIEVSKGYLVYFLYVVMGNVDLKNQKGMFDFFKKLQQVLNLESRATFKFGFSDVILILISKYNLQIQLWTKCWEMDPISGSFCYKPSLFL